MIRDIVPQVPERMAAALLSPGGLLSVWSLLAAFGIAVAVTLAKRAGRGVPLRVLMGAMFPRRWMTGRSARADICFALFGILASSALLGGAVVSHLTVADAVRHALDAVFGRLQHPVTGTAPVALATLALWLAYEFAYFIDHWLSHKLPVLWAFHKVHHSAETLSPLTVFRVHPVDSIVFYNIVALVTGTVVGALHHAFGSVASPWALAGTNVLTLAAIYTIKHLQHSHVWIAFTGLLGHVFLSPAHHQLHHSAAPEHHDRNFGATLALFDWLFGTLHMPQARREPLRFGVDGLSHDPHSGRGALIAPVADALGSLGLERLRPPLAALEGKHPAGIFRRQSANGIECR